MKTKRKLSLAALLLALLLIALPGCGGGKAEKVPEAELSGASEPAELEPAKLVFLNPLLPPEGSILRDDAPNLVPKLMEADAQNSDAVGWLQIPNTTMDEVVVQRPGDTSNSKAYYLRLAFDKTPDDYGSYFADYRNELDKGRDGLSKNTVIYGHSFTDNNNGLKMDQLKKFRDSEEFAIENPYIYLAVDGETLVWEIFAVVDTNIDDHYNNPNPTAEEFQDMISEAMKRSYYTYDTQVTASDKILTLSTCTYNYNAVFTYPNNFRYYVAARLVGPDEKLKEQAALVTNTSRKLPK